MCDTIPLQVLSDEKARREYDIYGRKGAPSSQRRSSAPPGFGFSRDGHRDGFSGFHFHDPFEVFRQFFGGRSPFDSVFDDDDVFGSGHDRSPISRVMSDPFGMGLPFGRMMGDPFAGDSFAGGPFGGGGGGGGGGFAAVRSFSSSSTFGGGRSHASSRSSSTVISNGLRVTRESVTENGVTTETVTEADARTGEVLRVSVNGTERPLEQLTGGYARHDQPRRVGSDTQQRTSGYLH